MINFWIVSLHGLGSNTGKRKLQRHPVDTVDFYNSQIMDKWTVNACGKSVQHRNSIKCKLCLTKAYLKCKYLNYVDSQYIQFSNKTWHCCNCSKDLFPFTAINNLKLYFLLREIFYFNSDSIWIVLNSKTTK